MKSTLKKILSILVVLTITVIPVNNVAADDGLPLYEDIEDLGACTSLDQLDDGWRLDKTPTTSYVEIGPNGGYQLTQGNSPIHLTSSGTKNSGKSGRVQKVFSKEFVDEENRTVIKNEKLQGVYDLKITYSYYINYVKTYNNVTLVDPYYAVSVGGKKEFLFIRMSSSGRHSIMNASSNSDNTMSVPAVTFSGFDTTEEHTLDIHIDTVNKSMEVVIDGDVTKKSTGPFVADSDYFTSFTIQDFETMGTGSYFNIKKVELYERACDERTATVAVLDSLPEKLVEDVNNVTEDTIDLLSLNGVTWTSSDKDVVSTDGVVKRGAEDKDVTLTATVDLGNGGGVYTKAYTITVAKAEEPDDDNEGGNVEGGNGDSGSTEGGDGEGNEGGDDVIEPPLVDSKVHFTEDFTSYSFLEQVKRWHTTGDGFATFDVVNGKGMEIKQTNSVLLNSSGEQNTTQAPAVSHVVEGCFGEDSEKRTAFKINRLEGKYKMIVNFEYDATPVAQEINGVKISEAYYSWGFGYATDANKPNGVNSKGLFLRVYPTYLGIMNSTNSSENTMSVKSVKHSSNDIHQLEVTFDTENSMVYVVYDGSAESSGPMSAEYINGFKITAQERMAVGTYMRIHSVEVQQLGESEKLDNAIEYLDTYIGDIVDDPYNVTEDIILPQSENIKWTSSQPAFISETGNVNRWYDDVDVVLTATYTNGNTILSKEFTLTVKADESASKTEILNEKISSEKNVELWKFANKTDKTHGDYEVSYDGVKIFKVTDATGVDVDVYTASDLLYVNDSPYNELTRSDLHSTGYNGIYDVSFDVKPLVKGNVPVNIKLGRGTDTVFAPAVVLNMYSDKISVTYQDAVYNKTEFIHYGNTYGNTYNVKVRVDTENQKAWVYLDDVRVTGELSFEGTKPVYMIDRLETSLSGNLHLGDGIVINNILLEEWTKCENTEKALIKNAIDKITLDDVTDNAISMESLKDLPDNIDGYNVVWTSNSNLINIEDGKVYHEGSPKDAMISAVISTVSGTQFRKNFYVTVRSANSEQELVEYIVSGLSELITEQNKTDIRYDMILPESYNGMTISWASSNEDIISDDGKLNKAAVIKNPTPVTMTATVNTGSSKVDVEFDIIVSSHVGEYVIYDGAKVPETFDTTDFENVRINADTITHIVFSQTDCNDGKITLRDSVGSEIMSIAVSNGCYDIVGKDGILYKGALANGTNETVDVMYMPDLGRFTVWAENKIVVDYAKANSSVNDYVGISASGTGLDVSSVKVTTDEYGMLDINIANVDYFTALDRVLCEDVVLETGYILPVTIKWKSSNVSVISDSGKVNVTDKYQFAYMTLTMEGENVSRDYVKEVAIGVPSDKNIAKKASVDGTSHIGINSSNISYLNDNKTDTVFGISTIQENFYVIYKFEKPEYVSALYIDEASNTIKAYNVSYSNDGKNWNVLKSGTINGLDSKLIEFDIINTKYLKFEVVDSNKSDVYIKELSAYLFMTEAEKIKLDIDSLELDIGNNVFDGIVVPETGIWGTPIIWTSSNESIISSSGKVNAPTKGTNVTLTATATIGSEKYSKEFVIYVPAATGNGGTVVDGSSGSGGGGGGASGGSVPMASTVPGFIETVPQEEKETETVVMFNDVPTTHWAFDAITTLKEAGIINGDGTGNFNPSDYVTREQFVKMLVELLGIETNVNVISFEDVNSSMWYAPYINSAVNAGIVNGISDVEFGVGSKIKREDMAVMMYRIIKDKKFDNSEVDFADDNEISDYAKQAVYEIRSAGIIEGYNNEFNPKDSLTRAEAATVLVRFMELIK